MRLSLTGAAGIGKTTMANYLASRLSLPILEEDFREIVEAVNPTQQRTDHYDLATQFRKAGLNWLAKREGLYSRHKNFIEDRCAVDVLFRWLTIMPPGPENTEIQQIIRSTKFFLDRIDFLILLPLTTTLDSINENELVRRNSTQILFRAQSLAIGIAHQLIDPSKIIQVAESCKTVEDRGAFILNQVALRAEKLAD